MEEKIWYTCSYTPLEILDAFGLVPVRTLGKEGAGEVADRYLHPNLCSYVKSILNSIQGEPPLPIVFIDSCDAMRRLSDAWSYFFEDSPIFRLNLPRIKSEEAITFFKGQLEELIYSLEEGLGESLSKERLRDSIRNYNRLRKGLLKIEEHLLHSKIRGEEYLTILEGTSQNSVQENISAIETFLQTQALKDKPTHALRLLLSGSPMAAGKELANLVEDNGGRVVYFDTCYTGRFYHGLVEEEGDPVECLARRYLLKTPCARMKNSYERFEELGQLIDRYQINGVLYHTLKFCDVFIYDYKPFENFLAEKDIPILRIETEYRSTFPGQMKTRLQAFMEML